MVPSDSATASSPPALLLLCGLLCDSSIWERQRAALADLTEVQVLDFPGFDSLSQMAAHVLAQAPSRFALAGHSMGARVAMEVLRQAPQRVDRLALLDTGVHPRTDNEASQRYALLRLAQEQGMHALARQWLPPMLHPRHRDDAAVLDPLLAMVAGHSAEVFAGQVQALLQRPDAAPLLPQIGCPTLLGVGRQDTWSPLARHQDMAARITDARLVVFEECGHMAPVEAPVAVAAALRDWLLAA
ncbi:alpha/beta fold hydrolase [Xanthomonas maliensis]|uniref:alpha/beta fold hydrolase n=1 Tax=Xanthomonas maliensis TaxID=1321368 RepID=UPI0003B5B41D|nr:alpha/beta hydrolase [Xanthomonas maliensis]KAB7767004.1 alpha/beta hydrolase [Xanthomonas maliensis]